MDYSKEKNAQNLNKIKDIEKELPIWFSSFIRSISDTTTSLTRLNYCYDTRLFFSYLIGGNVAAFDGLKMSDIKPQMLGELSLTNLEEYLEYIGMYVKNDETIMENGRHGKARKIASMRTLYKYLEKKELISKNPTLLLDMPKIHEKSIIRMEVNEAASFLDAVRTGDGLSDREKKHHERYEKRDMAIAVLFLYTGIRISELAGLDIGDVNFDDFSFIITRKGGNETIMYFNEDVEQALSAYMEERKAGDTYSADAPLFISNQNKRMNVKSIQNMIEKYAKVSVPLKHITPHKLRSTYGTTLYQETGDIYLVANVLGHKDINTTQKHYAAQSEMNKREASEKIKYFSDEK